MWSLCSYKRIYKKTNVKYAVKARDIDENDFVQ